MTVAEQVCADQRSESRPQREKHNKKMDSFASGLGGGGWAGAMKEFRTIGTLRTLLSFTTFTLDCFTIVAV